MRQFSTDVFATPEVQRVPTLPASPDGKVNGQAIALKQPQEKYLYERQELTSQFNLVAEGQGLLPIGSRLLVDANDNVLKERLVRQAQSAEANAQAAVETQSATGELLEKRFEGLPGEASIQRRHFAPVEQPQ